MFGNRSQSVHIFTEPLFVTAAEGIGYCRTQRTICHEILVHWMTFNLLASGLQLELHSRDVP